METTEPLWLFIDPLNTAGIPYMVTGATAAIVYGAPRLTNDLDLVVELTVAKIEELPALFPERDFYCPPGDILLLERQRANRGHFNLVHHETGYKADCYLVGSDPLHGWGMQHRREVRFGARTMWMAPLEYVIIRKLEYFREGESPKHIQDIKAMVAVSGADVDLAFLEPEVLRRGLAEGWRKCVPPNTGFMNQTF